MDLCDDSNVKGRHFLSSFTEILYIEACLHFWSHACPRMHTKNRTLLRPCGWREAHWVAQMQLVLPRSVSWNFSEVTFSIV